MVHYQIHWGPWELSFMTTSTRRMCQQCTAVTITPRKLLLKKVASQIQLSTQKHTNGKVGLVYQNGSVLTWLRSRFQTKGNSKQKLWHAHRLRRRTRALSQTLLVLRSLKRKQKWIMLLSKDSGWAPTSFLPPITQVKTCSNIQSKISCLSNTMKSRFSIHL